MKKENGYLYAVTNDDLKLLETNPEEFWQGVTVIGGFAFRDCTDLTSITIPDGVTKIGAGAFFGCSGLTSITIPDSVTEIGDMAFEDCTGLTSITIPDSVTEIGWDAFFACKALTSISIPDSVREIRQGTFFACKALTEIKVDAGNKNYSSEDGFLYNKGKTKLICCPEGKTSITIPDGVTEIGEEAFYCCTSLTSITISNSVTEIGDDAFYGCTGLQEIIVSASVNDDRVKEAIEDFKGRWIEVETEEIKPDEYYLNLTKQSFMTIDLFPVEKFSEGFVLKLKKAIYQQFEAEIEKIDVENKTQYNAIVEKMKHVKATIDNKQEKYKQYKKEEEIRNRAKDARKNELKDRLNELFPEEDDDGKAE